MITDEDYRAMQINCQRMEREMKAMRHTLLDDFAKAALIGLLSNHGCYQDDGFTLSIIGKKEARKRSSALTCDEVAEAAFNYAEAAIAERDKRYGTR